MDSSSVESRIRAVLLYIEGIRSAREICTSISISERTLRRWIRAYRNGGAKYLNPKKMGPKGRMPNGISKALEIRILKLKQKHPSWGARRIKYQYDLPCHWNTVHNVIKQHSLLIRIKKKPQPKPRRFRRKHVDSMWQGDTFHLAILRTGRVYVTGFLDDCSNYRVVSGAYLHKSVDESLDALRRALAKGRVPREMYLDNGGQFKAEEFKAELRKYHIKWIYGKPYNPRGRGKIESYHKILYRELVTQKRFKSLLHFQRELEKFDRRWNNRRKQQGLGWKTPASIYNDKRYFNKKKRN